MPNAGNPSRLTAHGSGSSSATYAAGAKITLVYDGEVLAIFPDDQRFDKDDGTFSGLTEAILLDRA